MGPYEAGLAGELLLQYFDDFDDFVKFGVQECDQSRLGGWSWCTQRKQGVELRKTTLSLDAEHTRK